MSYCLNPDCLHPNNNGDPEQCQTCGALLLLKGRYRALKPIGQGGFGRTFLAVDEGNGDRPPDEPVFQHFLCVIKQFLPQQRLQVSEIAALFQQEAMQLKELGKHPQIPQLFDFGSEGEQQFLIQQFIDGQNLAEELEERGTFDEAQIRELLLSLLPVLQFIHDRRVIHRDVKPTNIIRNRADGTLVLVDLGAAKAATETALMRTGTVIGSAEFTAPEQARGKATFASDLYSLGVTCVHLLTHVSPFDLYDTGEGQWVWRDFLRQPVSDALARVLDKLIEPATRRRYQSAIEVLQDLQQLGRVLLREDRFSDAVVPQFQPEGDHPFTGQFVEFAPDPSKPINIRQLGVDATLERATTSAIQRWHEGDNQIQINTLPQRFPTKQKRASFWLPLAIALGLLGILVPLINVSDPPQPEPIIEVSPPSAVPDESLRTIETGSPISGIAVDADGSIVLQHIPRSRLGGQSFSSNVSVWNPATGNRLKTVPKAQLVYSANYQPLPYLLTGAAGNTGSTQLKTAASNQLLSSLQTTPLTENAPVWLVLSQDRQTLMGQTFSDNSKVALWNVKTGQSIHSLPTQGFMPSAISPTGSVLAIANANTGVIDLLNVQTNQKVRSLNVPLKPQEQIVDLRFSPDGRTLLVAVRHGNGDIDLQFWQTGSGIRTFSTQVLNLDPSGFFTVPFLFHPDDNSLFTFSPRGNIERRDATTGVRIQTYSGFNTIVNPAISRDGQSMTWIQNDPSGVRLLQIMDIRTGTVVRSLRGAFREVNSIAFSNDGRQVITGGADGKLQIWSIYQFPSQ
jgi:serine/threonine protein kinase/WD40 repeat protein